MANEGGKRAQTEGARKGARVLYGGCKQEVGVEGDDDVDGCILQMLVVGKEGWRALGSGETVRN